MPPALAGEVLRRLLRDLSAEVRANGGRLTPQIYRLLWALRSAQDEGEKGSGLVRTPGGSVAGTPFEGAAIVETAAETARRMGCSESYVRRLARSGQLPARKVGTTWLITAAAGAVDDETEAA
ncbi:helix-turn-helix domain-containing protein [Streptomyces sp. NPDC052225]|uniref:helix-turn-helix domain-containing protein n=1 Tax=Streptomyces sp. NPDC052225 TaxID=3154949 RepID=UPI003428620C